LVRNRTEDEEEIKKKKKGALPFSLITFAPKFKSAVQLWVKLKTW
jgi:hypothetical protein